MHLTGLLSSAVDLNYDNMTSWCDTGCEVGRIEGISLIFVPLKSFGESIGNSLVPKTDRLQSKTILTWKPAIMQKKLDPRQFMVVAVKNCEALLLLPGRQLYYEAVLLLLKSLANL